MKAALEHQFSCRILAWGIPLDDLGAEEWTALLDGELLTADSFPLLLSLLQERTHRPLYLMAA